MHKDISRRIWALTICIMAIGLVALYSATFQNSRAAQDLFYDQLGAVGIGLVIMFFFSRVDYRKYYDAAYIFYLLNILLLVVVLVGGRHAQGARRWLEIGMLNFQPSELAKFSLILILSRYLSSRKATFHFSFLSSSQEFFRDVGVPFIFTSVLMVFIFKQPDLGTALLMFGIFVILLFAGGIRIQYVLWFLAFCLCLVPWAWHLLADYQKNRLLVFLNPNIDPLGAGYTIIQSKIAVGSGQIFGKGWLSGTQNQLNFLPERHTDFIFSVIGEEWGLLGAAVLIFCYFMLIHNGLRVAEQLKDRFGVLMVVGIVGILTLQVVINIGMVIGLLPVVGLTLPMVSYGRTSLLTFVIMIGVLLNIVRKGRAA